MYQQNNGISSNHCRVFDASDNVGTDDWHSMVLHPKGTHLLLVGNRELAWINLDTVRASGDHQTGNGMGVRPKIADFEVLPLFDTCNTNRPVVQWNPLRTDQYAVAIDRLVHLYTRDCKPIEKHSEITVPEHRTTAIIDSQHQVRKSQALREEKRGVRWPGVEPGSAAWKATMLTVTPPTHRGCRSYSPLTIETI